MALKTLEPAAIAKDETQSVPLLSRTVSMVHEVVAARTYVV